MADPDNYKKACEILDMKSTADYYAIMIYVNRRDDWPRSNKEMWKTSKTTDTEFGDGRWRYMLYDLNSWSMDIRMLEEDSIYNVRAQDATFNNLCNNEEFRQLFIQSMLNVVNNVFSYERFNQLLDDYEVLLTEPMKVHNKRFFGVEDYISDSAFEYPEDGYTYHEKINTLRSFLGDRRYVILYLLRYHFGVITDINDNGEYYIVETE